MNSKARDILSKVETWPEKDQAELAELAHGIEARRTGIYQLSVEEHAAIGDARHGAFASEDEVVAFWKRHGLA